MTTSKRKRRSAPKSTRRARGRHTKRNRPTALYRTGDIARVPVAPSANESVQGRGDSNASEARPSPAPVPATAQDPASTPAIAQYLTQWLADTVLPNREPATYAYYEVMARRYIIPLLGRTRLDQLQVRDVQAWLDQLARQCQCCAQDKDAARAPRLRRCCAIGECCGDYPGPRTIQAARNTLRATLNHAKAARLVSRNVAAFAQVPKRPQRAVFPVWTVEQAIRFLDSARAAHDPLYAAYALVLVNGLSKGEALGLTWPGADLDTGHLETGWLLQRIRGELIHKRQASATGTLPMPEVCLAALRSHREQQDAAREWAGDRWQASDLVFTTRWGRPVDPRNFYRSFHARSDKADVPRLRVQDTRQTCAALLAALGVPPEVAAPIVRHAQTAPAADIHVVSGSTDAAPKELNGGPAAERDLS